MRPEAEDSEATDLTDDSSCGAPAEEAKLYLRKRNKDKKLIKKVADIKVCFFHSIFTFVYCLVWLLFSASGWANPLEPLNPLA